GATVAVRERSDGFVPTASDDTPEVDATGLLQNYPNPFNPTTTITFNLEEPSYVRLDVFSVTGERVASLVNGTKGAGQHHVKFDASRLSTGIYVYRLIAGDITQSKKMLLVK
ncbi:MAG: T9SS type A sorting domain-containing protein, partial [Candidatus Latescibacterota bacterium]